MKYELSVYHKEKGRVFVCTFHDGDDFATEYMKEIGSRMIAEIFAVTRTSLWLVEVQIFMCSDG